MPAFVSKVIQFSHKFYMQYSSSSTVLCNLKISFQREMIYRDRMNVLREVSFFTIWSSSVPIYSLTGFLIMGLKKNIFKIGSFSACVIYSLHQSGTGMLGICCGKVSKCNILLLQPAVYFFKSVER